MRRSFYKHIDWQDLSQVAKDMKPVVRREVKNPATKAESGYIGILGEIKKFEGENCD